MPWARPLASPLVRARVVTSLLLAADSAMYQAKQAGGQQFVVGEI